MRIKNTIVMVIWVAQTTLLFGCAESAIKTANKQAEAKAKATPVEVPITTTYDVAALKTALGKGPSSISGVLYHRLSVSGRDDVGWPASPLIKNQPLKDFEIYLYPASSVIEEFDRMFETQQTSMQKWYLKPRNVFNQQPQTKRFILPKEVSDHFIKTKTDAFGRYMFTNIKPGRYYLFTNGWVSGKYNQDAYAGSSEYSRGTGIYSTRGRVDHYELKEVGYKTFLVYREFVNVGAKPSTVDSRFRVDYNEMSVQYDK